MTVYVIPDDMAMTPNQRMDLQETLQHHHADEKVIVLPSRSHVIIDRERCEHCGQILGGE